jgi:hypothetical protein
MEVKQMSIDDKQDYRIEEYKALRIEIIRHMEGLDRNLIACITATAIALVYGLKESPIVLLVANAVPMYFWIQHLNTRNKIAKIGSYIGIFLEGSDMRLMWERRTHSTIINSAHSRRSWRARIYLLPYATLLIASLLATFWSLTSKYFPSWHLGWLISISAIIPLIVWFVAIKLTPSFDKLIEAWDESFQLVKNFEESDEASMGLQQSITNQDSAINRART